MAAAFKIIWRLDHDVSYATLDRPGSVLKALMTTYGGFWKQAGDHNIVPHSVTVQNTDENCYRNISVEPMSLNGVIEWASAVDLKQVLTVDPFPKIDEIVKELLKICEIKTVNRAGIRFFCVGKDVSKANDRQENFGQFISPGITARVNAALDQIGDVGLMIEGTTKDQISYRLTFGPLEERNLKQGFQVLRLNDESLDSLMKNDYLF